MNSTAFMDNLLSSTHQLITQPQFSQMGINMSNILEEEFSSSQLSGGKKSKKKVKEIDTFKKSDLVKIAKKNDINLKARDGSVKTKEQLFNSLKRKKLI
jgi:hypothetical protein